MKHSYHAHHAPACGGLGSFLLGQNGATGGFVSPDEPGARQDVFVGYRYAGEPWTLLPFVQESTARAAGAAMVLLPHGRYGRTLGWASDRWMAQAIVWQVLTPFCSSAADEAVLLATPAVYALLDCDNTHMSVPVELVFAIADPAGGWFTQAGSRGDSGVVACLNAGRGIGFGAAQSEAVNSFDDDVVLGVGACGLRFHVPAGGKAVFPVVLGWGAALERTLAAALGSWAQARASAQRRDEELRATGLAEDARRQISLATRERLAARAHRPEDLTLAGLREELRL